MSARGRNDPPDALCGVPTSATSADNPHKEGVLISSSAVTLHNDRCITPAGRRITTRQGLGACE